MQPLAFSWPPPPNCSATWVTRDRALAAQTDAYPPVRHLTQKYRNLDAGNPDGVVHDTLRIFVDWRPVEPCRSCVTQSHAMRPSRCNVVSAAPSSRIFESGIAEVQILRNARRAGAQLDQVLGQREGVGAGAFITK